ncbi:MAG TPA: hypothetical protein VGM25_07295 [Caulobacteraceae bacterium]
MPNRVSSFASGPALAVSAAAILAGSLPAQAQPQPGTALPPVKFEVQAGYKVGRLPNGLPDWSGVWGAVGPRNMDPTTDTGTPQPAAPLNAEYARRYKARLDGFASGKPISDIGCLPEGAPRIMRAPYSMEVVATPKQTWLLMEFKNENRRIYTDGRKPMDPDPTYEGYSTGHWDGDALVFDTVALKAGTLDSRGLEHSDAMVLHERLRRVSQTLLLDEITMSDPKAFTKPWTVIRSYKWQPTWEQKEFICAENERNAPAADGSARIQLNK